jgi:hypothetical protein
MDRDLRLLRKLIDLGALSVGASREGLTSLGSDRKNLREVDTGGGLDFKDWLARNCPELSWQLLMPGESVNMDLDR